MLSSGVNQEGRGFVGSVNYVLRRCKKRVEGTRLGFSLQDPGVSVGPSVIHIHIPDLFSLSVCLSEPWKE